MAAENKEYLTQPKYYGQEASCQPSLKHFLLGKPLPFLPLIFGHAFAPPHLPTLRLL